MAPRPRARDLVPFSGSRFRFRLARRCGLVSRFREPEAAITALGSAAWHYCQITSSSTPRAAPTTSAEALMNRTNLDCFRAASSGSGGLIERSGWTCVNLPSCTSNRSQAAPTRFRFTRMNIYWARSGSPRARFRPDRIRRLNEPPPESVDFRADLDRSRSRASFLSGHRALLCFSH